MNKSLLYPHDQPSTGRFWTSFTRRTFGIWPTFGFMAVIWMALTVYTNERVLTPQVLANLATQS